MTKVWTDREKWKSARSGVYEALVMALGKGRIQDKLGFAAGELWEVEADSSAVMPDEARGMFDEILDALRKYKRGGGDAPRTIEMGDDEAKELMKKMFELYVELNDGI